MVASHWKDPMPMCQANLSVTNNGGDDTYAVAQGTVAAWAVTGEFLIHFDAIT
jgi:hypothetical protein